MVAFRSQVNLGYAKNSTLNGKLEHFSGRCEWYLLKVIWNSIFKFTVGAQNGKLFVEKTKPNSEQCEPPKYCCFLSICAECFAFLEVYEPPTT